MTLVPHLYPGVCQCGCGGKTPIATRTHKARNLVKGQPTRYLPGHQTRYNDLPAESEERGYETPCLIWKAATNSSGYPVRGTKDGGLYLVHRRLMEDRLADSLRLDVTDQVHHLCGQKLCVNLDHLTVIEQRWHIREHWHVSHAGVAVVENDQ